MDTRRLSTMDVMASGILSLPAPDAGVPTDRAVFRMHAAGGDEDIRSALDADSVVQASNYYGCFSAWKVADGEYRCVLLQYRQITADERFPTAQAATEWCRQMDAATDG